MGLYVITESIQSIEYLNNNGIYPDSYMVSPESIKEVTPYLCEDDYVLVLIQGLTDWTLLRASSLLSDLHESALEKSKLIVISNTDLGVLKHEYIWAKGDPVYGTFVNIDAKGKFGSVYKSNLKERLSQFSKPKFPTCLDVKVKRTHYSSDVNQEYFNHLVAVDISSMNIK